MRSSACHASCPLHQQTRKLPKRRTSRSSPRSSVRTRRRRRARCSPPRSRALSCQRPQDALLVTAPRGLSRTSAAGPHGCARSPMQRPTRAPLGQPSHRSSPRGLSRARALMTCPRRRCSRARRTKCRPHRRHRRVSGRTRTCSQSASSALPRTSSCSAACSRAQTCASCSQARAPPMCAITCTKPAMLQAPTCPSHGRSANSRLSSSG
mmetsp:Transcript_425/g.1106  ORF Transcript_425/g.1106 Transcript_425/m.1106 type:complete len:209 (-) Transcript_425:138-764(-)